MLFGIQAKKAIIIQKPKFCLSNKYKILHIYTRELALYVICLMSLFSIILTFGLMQHLHVQSPIRSLINDKKLIFNIKRGIKWLKEH